MGIRLLYIYFTVAVLKSDNHLLLMLFSGLEQRLRNWEAFQSDSNIFLWSHQFHIRVNSLTGIKTNALTRLNVSLKMLRMWLLIVQQIRIVWHLYQVINSRNFHDWDRLFWKKYILTGTKSENNVWTFTYEEIAAQADAGLQQQIKRLSHVIAYA